MNENSDLEPVDEPIPMAAISQALDQVRITAKCAGPWPYLATVGGGTTVTEGARHAPDVEEER